MKNRAAVTLGRLGGKSKSEAKRAAVRRNGRKGGRPRLSDEIKRLRQVLTMIANGTHPDPFMDARALAWTALEAK